MTPIPAKVRKYLATLPRMKVCERRSEGDCSGNIEWHHALISAGKQVQEPFAILAMCHWHHTGGGRNDEVGRLIAYNHASYNDLAKYPKSLEGWLQERAHLRKKYE